ncbi:family 76 glycoside hydrolase [Pestalotiopsis sp. NC0098]|nr:family 76 glycoside hydrolase [Pestalotiopsis sp. NC0098]
MTTYDPSTGLWNYNEPSAAWWQSAIALQAVLDFMITTGTRDYIPIANYTINTQRASVAGWPQGGGDFRAASTDDTGWWALAVLSMYSITGEKYLLDIAVADEAYMSQYWTSECNGGLIWQIRDLSYKAAISNELYIELTATLHNLIPGDEIYLERSLIAWEWLKGSGMMNGASLINDGLMSGPGNTCVNNNAPTWTYNQGVILGAMIQLQTATGDAQFINTARHIADAVLSSTQLVPQGILTEPCADGCTSADQHSFKGIFARYLAQLDAKLPDQPYGAFITSNAASMVAHDQVPSQDELANDLYGLNWQGPFDKNSLGSQESAVMLLTAALSVQM